MSDLPADREKALEAIANGWGRTPTAAHPLCICGKPLPESKPTGWVDGAGNPVLETYTAKDCPMHRPAGKASRQG